MLEKERREFFSSFYVSKLVLICFGCPLLCGFGCFILAASCIVLVLAARTILLVGVIRCTRPVSE